MYLKFKTLFEIKKSILILFNFFLVVKNQNILNIKYILPVKQKFKKFQFLFVLYEHKTFHIKFGCYEKL